VVVGLKWLHNVLLLLLLLLWSLFLLVLGLYNPVSFVVQKIPNCMHWITSSLLVYFILSIIPYLPSSSSPPAHMLS